MSVQPKKGPRRSTRKKLVSAIVLIIFGIIFLAPLLWVFLASFDGQAGLAASLPSPFTFDNYKEILTPDRTFIP